MTIPPVPAFDVDYRPDQIEEHISEFFYHSQTVLCHDLAERNHTSQEPLRVRYQLDCQDIFDHSDFGTGNWLVLLYNIRQAAYLLGQIELEMECIDITDETERTLILPWIMGTWEARHTSNLNWETACEPAWDFNEKILEDLRYELRRMAIAMVGVPHEKHPSLQFMMDPARDEALQVHQPSPPLLPNIELDEVAVHFRCGDILEKTPHPVYGYAKFSAIADLISEASLSIGIVTQPFHGGQLRGHDEENQGRCAILVGSLQSFLQQRFQHASVAVRNDPNETIALAYARFIMAQQAIAAGTSTFVTMPFRASFGAAYEIDREEMIGSDVIFGMWQEDNGQEKILNILTSNDLP